MRGAKWYVFSSPLFIVNILKVFGLSFWDFIVHISQYLFHEWINNHSSKVGCSDWIQIFELPRLHASCVMLIHIRWISGGLDSYCSSSAANVNKGKLRIGQKHLSLMHMYGNNKQTVLALEYSAGSILLLFTWTGHYRFISYSILSFVRTTFWPLCLSQLLSLGPAISGMNYDHILEQTQIVLQYKLEPPKQIVNHENLKEKI